MPLRAVRSISLGVAAVLLLAGGSVGAAPQPKPAACPVMINACGCVITHTDTYVVVNDLNATQSNQNCIEVAASNSILNLKGARVYGKNDGTGIGILIRKGADHVIVEGGDESTNTPAQNPAGDPADVLSSGQAEVSQWKIGIEDDGDSAIIALFRGVGGLPLLPHPSAGNTAIGILLKGVKDSFVGDLTADFNGQFGIMLKQSHDITLANFSADHNGDTGLKLDSSDGNSIGPAGAASNDKRGMWLQSSSRNTIHDSNGNSFNGDTGILLAGGSSENRITNAGAPRNDMAGIVITLGSMGNTVTVTHNEDNGAALSDMIDRNPDCDHNVWYNNVGHANQSCIQ